MKSSLFLVSALLVLALPWTAQAAGIFANMDLHDGGAYDPLTDSPPALTPLYVIPPNEALDAGFLFVGGNAVGATNLIVSFDLSGFVVGTTGPLNGADPFGFFFDFTASPAGLAALNAPGATGFLTATNIGGSGGLTGTNSVTFGGNLSPVPEPSTFVLFGLGLLAAGRVAQKRRLALSQQL